MLLRYMIGVMNCTSGKRSDCQNCASFWLLETSQSNGATGLMHMAHKVIKQECQPLPHRPENVIKVQSHDCTPHTFMLSRRGFAESHVAAKRVMTA